MLFSELVQVCNPQPIFYKGRAAGWRVLFRERSTKRLYLASGSVTFLRPWRWYHFGPAVADELVFVHSGILRRDDKKCITGEHLWFDEGAPQSFGVEGPRSLVTTTIFGATFTHLQLSLQELQMGTDSLNFLLANALAEATREKLEVTAADYEKALGAMSAELWREPTSK